MISNEMVITLSLNRAVTNTADTCYHIFKNFAQIKSQKVKIIRPTWRSPSVSIVQDHNSRIKQHKGINSMWVADHAMLLRLKCKKNLGYEASLSSDSKRVILWQTQWRYFEFALKVAYRNCHRDHMFSSFNSSHLAVSRLVGWCPTPPNSVVRTCTFCFHTS